MTQPACPLCHLPPPPADSALLYAHPRWRVVDAQEPSFPGFTRIIWRDHVQEMTDLPVSDQQELMTVVLAVETVMRQKLSPDKINLASLGNQVPHLHWHVIPRWQDDASFPQSVWTPAVQPAIADTARLARQTAITRCLPEYHQALINRLKNLSP